MPIVGERLRATMGLPIRKMSEHAPLSEGIDASAIDEKYYDPHLLTLLSLHAMHVLRNVFLLQTHVRDV